MDLHDPQSATVAQCLTGDILLVSEASLLARATPTPSSVEQSGTVAIVSIMGPLAQRAEAGWFGEVAGYDSIEADFAAALESSADAVVLRIDSPGGDAAGCFEAVGRMRAAAQASGKPVVAFADELAASAAYALACVADAGIVVPKSGMVGSVGVISMHVSQARALADAGVDVSIFRSGKRKAEGTMAEPLSDSAAATKQARVDALAKQFGALVADAREMSAAEVLGHEGAIFTAGEGVSLGFADRIGSLTDAVELAVRTAKKRAREKKMNENIKALVGLSADASDDQILAGIASLADAAGAGARIMAALGAKSADDAVGIVDGLNAIAAQVEATSKRNAELEVEVAKTEVEAAIREGSESGKITAQAEAYWREKPAAEIRAYLKVAPVVVNREVAQPAERVAIDGARLWGDFSVSEKAALQKSDPELFAALLKDHRSRNGGRK